MFLEINPIASHRIVLLHILVDLDVYIDENRIYVTYRDI